MDVKSKGSFCVRKVDQTSHCFQKMEISKDAHLFIPKLPVYVHSFLLISNLLYQNITSLDSIVRFDTLVKSIFKGACGYQGNLRCETRSELSAVRAASPQYKYMKIMRRGRGGRNMTP